MDDCPICKGIGFVYEKTNVGQGRGQAKLCKHVEEQCLCDGKPPYEVFSREMNMMLPCPCKDARSKLHNMLTRYDKAAIPPRYQWVFLEDFKTDWTSENDAETQLFVVADWAHHFIDNYTNSDVEKRGMFLFGPPGVGKTLICCIILNELMRRYDADCRYAKVTRDFLGAIQASYSKVDQSYGQSSNIQRRLQNVEVLILDDFGIQKDSQWSDAILYDLIDSRYENDRMTLFTSNKMPEDLKDMGGGRIFSRLQEMTRFIVLDIPDFRQTRRA